jgi:hypothetical protein
LGGPNARGILVPPPPITISIGLEAGNVVLNWSGGDGSYQLQKNDSLTNLSWQNVGGPTDATNAVIPRDIQGGYFRVIGQL